MIKKLVEAGVHFGHLVSRWCPKMRPYIWGHRNKVHLIDVSKTAVQLDKAAKFLESVAAEGKQILWVGTKKAAQEPIKLAAEKTGMPFVSHRWIGGTLSNNSQVKKSVTKLQHHEDIVAKAEQVKGENQSLYTKKEINVYQKIADRLEKNVGGIRTLKWPLGALVVVDVSKEAAAVREALKVGVPVVAIVDTNGDPSQIDFVIPGNDDAPKSILAIFDPLVEAILKGRQVYQENKAAHKEQEKVAKGAKKAAAPVELLGLEDEVEEEDKRKTKDHKGLNKRIPQRPKLGSKRSSER